MASPLDLSGQRFGRLIAKLYDGGGYWICACDCGKQHRAWNQHLKRGLIRSCGCFNDERRSETKTKHGGSSSRAYVSWANMLARCRNPKNRNFAYYGGRGIRVCEEWADFATFIRDMGEPPDESHNTVERKDVNGHYEPANCVWATRQAQARNTRANVFYEWHGQRLTLRALAEASNTPYGTLRKRLARGIPVDEATQHGQLSCRSLQARRSAT